MNEKLGVEVLKSLAKAFGQVAALLYAFVIEKSGIIALVWGLKDPGAFFQEFFSNGGKLSAAKEEALDLSVEESKSIDAELLGQLPPAFQEKLAPYNGLLVKCIDFVGHSIEFGKSAYAEVVGLVAGFKALFGKV